MKGLSKLIIFTFLFSTTVVIVPNVWSKIHDYKPFSSIVVKFKLKRVHFKVGEPIMGRVVLENDYPGTIPAVFKIQLYHDGLFVSEVLTSVKTIPFGHTDFTLQNFGVPSFNSTKDSVGRWQIKILQQNLDEKYAKIGTLYIVANKNKEKK
jgi:hypothetical protein